MENASSEQMNSDVTSAELETAKDAWNNVISRLPPPKQQQNPILPVAGEKNILITSSLPYVNNVPHLGNIIGCVLSADVFARFSRLCNHNTLYICGTDEYGTATETKALQDGVTPQALCDKYYEVHREIYEWFNISFDQFGRTTTPEQTSLVQEMFLHVQSKGFITRQDVEQWLCTHCERYLADRFVEGGCPHPGCGYADARGDQCDGCGKLVNAIELQGARCKVCGATPTIGTSAQFFLDLPKIEPKLAEWIEVSSPGWSSNARVIARSWLKEGLKQRCITRDLKWGVSVPLDGYREKVFYVWFDAPIGYMSITKRYSPEHWLKWWKPSTTNNTDVTLYQFMAKDNVPFHSIMFPAVLLAADDDYVTVSHIMATEYLNYEDGKFSKSRSIGVFGTDARNTGIPSDVWRFYLLYIRPEAQDSSFSWSDLATKVNAELLNNLGNFVNRALVFVDKYYGGVVPVMRLAGGEERVLALCGKEVRGYVESVGRGRLRDGVRCILAVARHGNQYLQASEPWKLVKSDTEDDKINAGTVIGICCNIACLLATLLHPYMPDTSATMRSQLNAPDSSLVLSPTNCDVVNWLPAGHKIGKPAPLFTKIEADKLEEMKKQFGGKQQPSEMANGAIIVEGGGDVASIETDLAKQADKVRLLKSSGAEKSLWQPEVKILQELKAKLEAAKKSLAKPATKTTALPTNADLNPEEIKKIEAEIQEQGEKVRQLKTSKAEKSVWQPEVDLLLELKGKLAIVSGKPLATPGKVKTNKK